MPDYLHRTTFNKLHSVAPADLPEPIANYIEYPDYSVVDGWPIKYWTITGDVISLVDQAARDAIDAAELTARRDEIANDIDRVESYTRAFALVVLDEINILRAQHSLTARTIAQLKTAVRNKLDT